MCDEDDLETLALARNCSAFSLSPGWTFLDRVVIFVRASVDAIVFDEGLAFIDNSEIELLQVPDCTFA